MKLTPVRRRVFLRLVAATALSSSLPALPLGCRSREQVSPLPIAPRFFSDDERAALGTLVDHVLPPDHEPGASALGVVGYIEALLTAFAHDLPQLHAGGPYSGRQPFADAEGAPSNRRPDAAFATWIPLDRVSLAGLRLYLYGSSGVPGGGPNDAALGPVVGLRDLVQGELRRAMQGSAQPLAELDDAALDAAWKATSADFQGALVGLVAEGAFAAPEYGGNLGGAGWELVHFEGDTQPFGYSHYDEAAAVYRESAGAPVSTADLGPDPAPFDAETIAKLDLLAMITGGKKFS